MRGSRTRKQKSGHPSRWISIPLAAAASVLVVAALLTPRTVAPAAPAGRSAADGPDSYFHHVYDPDHLLGLVGDTDLALDNLERLRGVAVLVAAFPQSPKDDPDFTVRLAERWAPGHANGDTGMVLFVFPGSREVRAEIGYGLESSFPDAVVAHILEESVLPAFAAGDYPTGLMAAATRITARLDEAPVVTPGGRSIDVLAEFAAIASSMARTLARGAGAWLAAPLPGRLILGGVALTGVAILAGFLVQLAVAVVLTIRFLWHRLVRRDHERAYPVLMRLGAASTRALQILALLFVMATGVSVFVHGSGRFGGAGVALRWPDVGPGAVVHSGP